MNNKLSIDVINVCKLATINKDVNTKFCNTKYDCVYKPCKETKCFQPRKIPINFNNMDINKATNI